MTEAQKFHRMAAVFERKADEAAASNEPWALGNLRLYQNKMSEFLAKAYEAERTAAIAAHLAAHERKVANRTKARNAKGERNKKRGLQAFVNSIKKP